MKTTGEILHGGLLAIALTMTLGSVLSPPAEAEALTCLVSPNHVCRVSLREDVWLFEDYRLDDEELE